MQWFLEGMVIIKGGTKGPKVVARCTQQYCLCTQQFKWSDKNVFYLNFKNPLPLISLVHSIHASTTTQFLPPPSLRYRCRVVVVVSLHWLRSGRLHHLRRGKVFLFCFLWFRTTLGIRVIHKDYLIHTSYTD